MKEELLRRRGLRSRCVDADVKGLDVDHVGGNEQHWQPWRTHFRTSC